MKQEMQELPFIIESDFDADDYAADVYSPESDAAHKHITNLTIDEAISFRQISSRVRMINGNIPYLQKWTRCSEERCGL
jgi:hypothetical protein